MKALCLFCLMFTGLLHASTLVSDNLSLGAHDIDRENSFLVISDIHLNVSKFQPKMVFAPKKSSQQNDLDRETFAILISTLTAEVASGKIAKPKFILLLGDLVGHQRQRLHAVSESEHVVFESLKKAFPETPVFYLFGNNDSFVGDYGPFRNTDASERLRSPLDVLRLTWPQGRFLSSGILCKRTFWTYPCLLQSKTTNGYYAAYLAPNLRLLSLNSVMFSRYSSKNNGPSDDQLKWLETQLAIAESKHESVLIAMHVPPGKNVYRSWFGDRAAFWRDDLSERFVNLLQEHSSVVIGVLAAHTHKDELKVVQKKGKPLTGIYLNAALSTSHGNAPSIRSYKLRYQRPNWNLVDYQTYYFTKDASEVVALQSLYEFRTIYCRKDEESMTACLANVTPAKMQRFFSAGNDKHFEKIRAPQNIYIK
ncbi:MAG: metallophosphoesterase [Gammaproteobacteria bacterium]|nr:metallophosphoesterase [Gammaproteobacteria bacterium]